MIDAKMAKRLRDRGLVLTSAAIYSTPELTAIAKRMEKLVKELDSLDKRIVALAK